MTETDVVFEKLHLKMNNLNIIVMFYDHIQLSETFILFLNQCFVCYVFSSEISGVLELSKGIRLYI
jgi:hypothetical protein